MRVHPDEARRYSDLKRELASRYPDDMDGYVDGKDSFVKERLALAIAWRKRQRLS